MDNPSPGFLQQKLFVCLYSDPNFFSLTLLENLLSKNCLVNIITENPKGWEKITTQLNKSKFGITRLGNNFVRQQYSYAIYVGGFIDKSSAYKNLKDFFEDDSILGVKSMLIFPFETFSKEQSESLPINDNLSVIYLGDLLGPRMDLDSDLFMSQSIKEILYKRKLSVEIGEVLFPVFAAEAAKTISKWLFSFGPYGKEIFLLGPETSSTSFWKENKKFIQDLELLYDEKLAPRKIPRGYEIENINSNLAFALSQTYKWITDEWTEKPKEEFTPPVKKVVIKKTKKKVTRPMLKFVKPLLVILTILLIFPFVTTATSAGILFMTYKQFVKGESLNIENRMLMARTIFLAGRKESYFISYIPIVGALYKEIGFVSWVGENVAETAIEIVPTISVAGQMFEKTLGDEIYDPEAPSGEIKKTLEVLYRRLALIQLETKDAAKVGVVTANKLIKNVDFERLKTLTSKGEILAGDLPAILGKDKKKSYLILFQNNMELRPTGGFIGSFGVTKFDGGRMTELTVNDVYSADGQLKGHVEPPTPIKDYLGEANWWLRDSNWDPDFPTSAQRAEWFLDKETDQKVDGVIALDLEIVKDILKYTGPIFLPDYELTITSENLYEKTQTEVESNFFPGTHKKASFLTALSRNLLAEVEKLDHDKKGQIMKAIFESLEGRHLQVYLHDENSQSAINEIGWGGSVSLPDCGDKCFPDFLGLVEANVGVNKSNYFIKRKADLEINVDENEVKNKLTVELTNSGNPALGDHGRYKVYMRLLVPEDAEITGVNSIIGLSRESVPAEIVSIKGRKEVGILATVYGGRTRKIEYNWQRQMGDGNSTYGLYVRKQAGVSDDPWSIQITTDKGKLEVLPFFNLTKSGAYTYNMLLERDFVSLFKWKNE